MFTISVYCLIFFFFFFVLTHSTLKFIQLIRNAPFLMSMHKGGIIRGLISFICVHDDIFKVTFYLFRVNAQHHNNLIIEFNFSCISDISSKNAREENLWLSSSSFLSNKTLCASTWWGYNSFIQTIHRIIFQFSGINTVDFFMSKSQFLMEKTYRMKLMIETGTFKNSLNTKQKPLLTSVKYFTQWVLWLGISTSISTCDVCVFCY